MLLMFEQGIRGGITQAVRKYASANDKYMGDRFDPKSESSYLQCLDMNNLYVWQCHNFFQLEDLNGLM